MMTGTVELLREQDGIAAQALTALAPRPLKVDDNADGWMYPTPISWTKQVGFLWYSAYDALRVLRVVLPQWASHSVLAQVRFIAETDALAGWLLEDEAARQSRAYGLALRDIDDEIRVANRFQGGLRTATSLHNLREARFAVAEHARSAGIQPLGPPRTSADLMQLSGPEHRAIYGYMSDVGIHAGFSYLEQFSRVEDHTAVEIDDSGAFGVRAYFLGLATETYVRLAMRCADAAGWEGDIPLGSALFDRLRAVAVELHRLTTRSADKNQL